MSGFTMAWLTFLQTIAHDSRWFILNLIGIGRLRWKTFDKKATHLYLIVTLSVFNHGRYGFQLLNYFSLAGYRIVFYQSLGFLFRLRRYDRGVLSLPGAILWRESMASIGQSFPWMRLATETKVLPTFPVSLQFLVDLNFFGQMKHPSRCFYLPYFVHPLLGPTFSQSAIKDQKRNRRRIFMYGEPNLPSDKGMVHDFFGLIDRSSIFEMLHTSDIAAYEPTSFEDLLHWLGQEEATAMLCLLDSRKVWIPIERWIEVLSSFDFFIATPGYCMPHAHNLIEALGVGTIPMLQYHNQLRPALLPNVHCIVFSDPGSMLSAVRQALQFSVEQVTKMRESVLDYYSQFVDPAAVVPRIFKEAAIEKQLRLYFNAEEMSLPYLEAGLLTQ
ncbi:MAG: hypothetical protein FJX89_01765 [Bacteroidetes bacterium]|nr:hypothetical protein [Bacteroidota bacterium]